MLIDCGTCQVKGDACTDCVVAIVLDSPGGLEADDIDRRALHSLATVGLVPSLRHEPRVPRIATPSPAPRSPVTPLPGTGPPVTPLLVTERVERVASG